MVRAFGMNPKVGSSSPCGRNIFCLKNFRHFRKNIHSWVENECCCPRTVGISNVNFTNKKIDIWGQCIHVSQYLQWERSAHIEGILPKGPYLPCVSMTGRALFAGYPRYTGIIYGNQYHIIVWTARQGIFVGIDGMGSKKVGKAPTEFQIEAKGDMFP